MKLKDYKEAKWFNGAVIACIGVAFFVLLTNFPFILEKIGHVLGYFHVIFLGMVLAYILNPVANFFYFRVFGKMKRYRFLWSVCVLLALVVVLSAIVLLMGIVLPQLVQSLAQFSENFDSYASALKGLQESGPLKNILEEGSLDTVTDDLFANISGWLKENVGSILGIAAYSGKSLVTGIIALILAVYMLIDKKRIAVEFQRLMKIVVRNPENRLGILDFFLRCDVILMNYLGKTLLDALIIGIANAIFMLICRMPYVGLISFVVAVTNLIPNFGPAIGAVIGAFMLLLANPQHVLGFLLFCLGLQFVDGYILKPKLFSDALGVSGLLILISTIVLGNMFGIPGVLLSIPAAAVLSFIYKDYFLPRYEKQ